MSRGSLPSAVISVLLRLGRGLGLGGDGLDRPTLDRSREQRLKGVSGEHDVFVLEDVVRVDLINGDHVNASRVAQRLPRDVVIASEHHEGRAAGCDGPECVECALGRRQVASAEALENVDSASACPVGEGTAKRGGLHLLGGALRVVARLRAVHHATAGHLRSAAGALTSAAGALLLERLLTSTGNHGARLGSVRALAGGGALRDDDLVDERNVGDDVKHVAGQVNRTGLLALGVDHVDGQRVSHGNHAPFAAERMRTTPPLLPGTAPLISRKPLSRSTPTTRRFCTVLRSLPMRPAILMPLKTRDGVEAPPIEPGLRWLRWAPWEAPTPWKP